MDTQLNSSALVTCVGWETDAGVVEHNFDLLKKTATSASTLHSNYCGSAEGKQDFVFSSVRQVLGVVGRDCDQRDSGRGSHLWVTVLRINKVFGTVFLLRGARPARVNSAEQ